MMAVNINVKSDIDKVMRKLADEARKQVPFATALAITRTAKAVEQDLRGELGSKFDRPTPYVAKGTFSTSAKKTDLTAWVGMRDQARRGASPAQYVKESFGGGARGLKPYEKVLKSMGVLPEGMRTIPGAGIKLDRNGNPPRRVLAEIIGAIRSRKNIYKGRGSGRGLHAEIGYVVVTPGRKTPRTAHLDPGIWRRTNHLGKDERYIVPVLLFVEEATYRQVIDLAKVSGKTIKRVFRAEFNRALERAMRTAR